MNARVDYFPEAAAGRALPLEPDLRRAAHESAAAVHRSLELTGPPVAIDADARHFRLLMAIIGVVAVGMAVLMGWVFLQHGQRDHGVGALGLGVLGGGMLAGRLLVRRSNLTRAVVLTSAGILAFVVTFALAGNPSTTLAMTCLLAVLIAVPYVDGGTLRKLGLVAWFAAAIVGLLVALDVAPGTGAAGPPEGLVRFLGVCINMGIAVFAIAHLSARLNSAVERYRDLFRRVPVGMYRTTPDGRFLDVNGAFAAMFGFDGAEELTDVPADDLYADPADRVGFRTAVDRAGVVRAIEYRARRPDGRMFWVRDSAMLVRAARGNPLYYEGIVEDVTERKHHELKLEQRASMDALTGLANRAVLLELLDEALAAASPSRPVALLFVDLDRFKRVNDEFGHAAGDAALVEASRRLRLATRAYDTIARFGGDEFAALLEVPTDAAAARAVADRVVAAFEEPFIVAACSVAVGASVGVAIAEEPITSAELISRADTAMYQSKARA